jgi:integrating conjugative element relaxase (TIGR03760 family)
MFCLQRKSKSPHPECLSVKLPLDLLGQHSRHIREIQQLVGIPPPHWRIFYLDALLSYANYVQLLPASEAHHHAGAGGLLAHGLEVALHALRLRRAHLLPQGADTEEIVAKREVWTYAVFSAALLHDIGKPLMDQDITLYDHRGCDVGPWDALTSPLSPNSWYRIRFRRTREYRLHERVAPLLSQLVLPQRALAWLGTDRSLLASWLAAVGGTFEEAGILGEIIQQADGLSVAEDLGAARETTRLPGTRQPLHERLLTGLRFLLKENKIPLNRNGAAAWFDGERLWLVSKRGIDTLREHLTQEGHTGVPSRNDRIFDELQENGILIPNGDRSIWKAIVTADDWSHTLTFLCFPAVRLWPDPGSRPEIFAGTITPVEIETGDIEVSEPTTLKSPPLEKASGPHHPDEEIPPSDTPVTHTPSASGFDPIEFFAPTPSDPDQRTEGDAVASSTRKPAESDIETGNDPGQTFLDWLHDGLKQNRFEINATSARLHCVEEGLLLVSPGIFKDFDRENWQRVQKRFQKLKIHRKTAQGTNIHTYQVTGKRSKSRINGILIEDPERRFEGVMLPECNPHLALGKTGTSTAE